MERTSGNLIIDPYDNSIEVISDSEVKYYENNKLGQIIKNIDKFDLKSIDFETFEYPIIFQKKEQIE